MAGHSKWANIKHRKARQDASRGKVWTKVIREITVAAKGGPYPSKIISSNVPVSPVPEPFSIARLIVSLACLLN
jgi:hypothetical protein